MSGNIDNFADAEEYFDEKLAEYKKAAREILLKLQRELELAWDPVAEAIEVYLEAAANEDMELAVDLDDSAPLNGVIDNVITTLDDFDPMTAKMLTLTELEQF